MAGDPYLDGQMPADGTRCVHGTRTYQFDGRTQQWHLVPRTLIQDARDVLGRLAARVHRDALLSRYWWNHTRKDLNRAWDCFFSRRLYRLRYGTPTAADKRWFERRTERQMKYVFRNFYLG